MAAPERHNIRHGGWARSHAPRACDFASREAGSQAGARGRRRVGRRPPAPAPRSTPRRPQRARRSVTQALSALAPRQPNARASSSCMSSSRAPPAVREMLFQVFSALDRAQSKLGFVHADLGMRNVMEHYPT